MRVQIKKWGDSAAIPIPAPIMAAVALRIDQEVEVREEEGRIVIEPVLSPTYNLDELLAGMTSDTFPDPVEFGSSAGNKFW
ncbi:AbrB/MazE/SpoVT family DNA-binding domain-containing protein [Sphingobium bisphenolivorans]|uniref:AbrB/MazE/SpoVT family DNA-binding domain-containing protein n=1 Tax=Sphingobium bisphenolivorans TaxID=1335760 RepID=UPI00055AFD5F|nr:AbrB/MazE/SpoVT family DNA-binding domain-containing protein [Sphingobium bisphenolivorans]